MHIFEVLNRGKFLKGDKDEISKMGLEGLGLKMRKNASKTRQNKKNGDGWDYYKTCTFIFVNIQILVVIFLKMSGITWLKHISNRLFFPQILLIHALKET